MKYFDLHCDTLTEICDSGKDILHNDLHISLDRAKNFEKYVQTFACFIPDEYRGEAAVSYFNKLADKFYECLNKEKDISLYSDKNTDTKIKAILSVEGGAALGGKIENVKYLYDRGVKIMTLTWNAKNEIAHGAYEESGGLTSFGKDVIREMENLGIVADVSHLNRESFFDVAKVAKKPFIATHSNADIVNKEAGHKRNLTDEQIKVIRDMNGLIGLNFYMEFLDDENAQGTDAILRQIEHFLNLGCEDVIAIGSDFDGCTVCDELDGIQKIENVKNTLMQKGVSRKLLEKIFYENANGFFTETLKY